MREEKVATCAKSGDDGTRGVCMGQDLAREEVERRLTVRALGLLEGHDGLEVRRGAALLEAGRGRLLELRVRAEAGHVRPVCTCSSQYTHSARNSSSRKEESVGPLRRDANDRGGGVWEDVQA